MNQEKKGEARLISLKVDDDVLRQDLVHLKQMALELGASMAEIVPAQWAEVDERVRLKCANPLCSYYGMCIQCPPHHGIDLELMRRAIERYQWAILFALDVKPVELFAGNSEDRKAGIQWSRKCMEITGQVETLAFGRGYYLALGLSQSCCQRALCHQDRCLVLQGEKCPFPLKSRSSIECLGIDVFRMVTRAGWEIYPIYRSVDPAKVPRASAVGIVFVC